MILDPYSQTTQELFFKNLVVHAVCGIKPMVLGSIKVIQYKREKKKKRLKTQANIKLKYIRFFFLDNLHMLITHCLQTLTFRSTNLKYFSEY